MNDHISFRTKLRDIANENRTKSRKRQFADLTKIRKLEKELEARIEAIADGYITQAREACRKAAAKGHGQTACLSVMDLSHEQECALSETIQTLRSDDLMVEIDRRAHPNSENRTIELVTLTAIWGQHPVAVEYK